MSDRWNFVCAVACILMALGLHGCDQEIEQAKAAINQGYSQAVQGLCSTLVHEQLDNLVLAGATALEDQCKADDVLDDSMCVGWALEEIIKVETSQKAEWIASCVAGVNEAVANAQGNLMAAATFAKEWWAENGDQLKQGVTNYTSKAYESASGALSQGYESSVIKLCELTVEGTIAGVIFEVQSALAGKCTEGAKLTGANATACQENGDAALTALEAEQVEKQEGECVAKVSDGLDWTINKLGEFKAKITEWWAANGDKIKADTNTLVQAILDEAAAKGIVTQRLYADRGFGLSGNSIIFAAAGTSALLAVFIGAFVLRLRRARSPAYEATLVAEDRELELE